MRQIVGMRWSVGPTMESPTPGRWTVSVPDQVRARTARRGRAPRRTASPLGGGCDRRFRSHTPSAVSAPRDPQQVGRAAAGRHQHARVDSGCLRLQWPNGQEVWLDQDEGWQPDGTFQDTGEGQRGPMALERGSRRFATTPRAERISTCSPRVLRGAIGRSRMAEPR